jgi:hypothetical protein
MIYFNKIYDNDLTDSICVPPPNSYMVSPFNWTSLAHRSENGNNVNTQSNYVGFRISSDGGLSFGGGSSSIAFGNSSGAEYFSFGGSSNDVDDGVIGAKDGMGINISYGVGGTGHGGSGGFFVDNGSGHGSSHLANNISKSSSYIRTSLGLGYMSISFLI